MCYLCPQPPKPPEPPKPPKIDRPVWSFTMGLAVGWLFTCVVWSICQQFDKRDQLRAQLKQPVCAASVALTKRSIDALDECLASLKSCAGVR